MSRETSVARGIHDKRTRKLFQRAVAEGWRWRVSGSTHVVVYPGNGTDPIVFSTTRISRRDSVNNVKLFERGGIK
jgi:hypothetical protein